MAMNCLDGSGYTVGETIRGEAVSQAALIRQVAAIAIAVDNAARLISNYKKQRDIANRSTKIAEENQDQLKQVFWPREEQFLAEFSNPEAIESIEVMGRRYGGRIVAPIAAAFARQIKEARCGFSRHCTSANAKQIQDLMIARARAIANARVLGRRIAFEEFQARNDRNFERRMQAAALGRGLMDQVADLLRSAGAGLATAGAGLSESLSSAMEAFTYARYRSDPGGEIIPGAYAQMQQGYARAPGVVGNQSGIVARPGFDLNTQGTFMDTNAGAMAMNTQVNPSISSGGVLASRDPFSTNQGLQMERWNEGDVGNRDLARTGTMTYMVEGGEGGQVTVSMSDFPLQYVDDKNPGDT